MAAVAGAASAVEITCTVRAAAEAVAAARAERERAQGTFGRSSVPLLAIDNRRRYRDANRAARLVMRVALAELTRLRVDDLTPADFVPALEAAWAELMAAGRVSGVYDIAAPDGGRFEVVYHAIANVTPGTHIVAFAPADWLENELRPPDARPAGVAASLTPRERELLQLAALGRNGPRIAEELGVSPATVKKHFEHIYAKLDVGDRAAAVAVALRFGLIE